MFLRTVKGIVCTKLRHTAEPFSHRLLTRELSLRCLFHIVGVKFDGLCLGKTSPVLIPRRSLTIYPFSQSGSRCFSSHLATKPEHISWKGKHRKQAEMGREKGKQGKNKKAKGHNNGKTQKVPVNINLVVVGSGGPGTSRSLLLTTEYSKYLFNCGEGTQRHATMSKSLRATAYTKIAGLENIFITYKSWENTGGLLGLAMSLEGQKNPDSKIFLNNKKPNEKHETQAVQTMSQIDDDEDDGLEYYKGRTNAAIPRMNLYGPAGVENITMMAKKFSTALNMNIVRHEGIFRDSAIKITPVVFRKDSTTSSETGIPAPKRQKRESSVSHILDDRAVSYAYLCEAVPPIPKINVEKCFHAGIKLGPMVGLLQRGHSVTLEDGTVVRPEQVTDIPATSNKPFLVVECPSLEFLPSLRASPRLQPYTSTEGEGEGQSGMALIAHMTPPHVFRTDDYQAWMRSFGEETDHLVLNDDALEMTMKRVGEQQARLNLIDPLIFPLLAPAVSGNIVLSSATSTSSPSSSIVPSTESPPMPAHGVLKASSGLVYVHRGKRLGFQLEPEEVDVDEVQKNYLDYAGAKEEVEKLRTKHSDNAERDDVRSYSKVTFLGTGSSEPNRVRGQSCILVQLSKHASVILDCGEDSYGQLFRLYGKERTNKVLRKVKAIFVSHMHADHHLGLFTLMKKRKEAIDAKGEPFEPVVLMAPVQMRRWLRFYHTELEPVAHLFKFCKHQDWLEEFNDGLELQGVKRAEVMESLGLVQYEPVPVIHCKNAFGVALTHRNGYKLVYSGDTRPCDELVAAGKGCDLLIHEATHEDALIAHAKASRHTTFSEAVEIGERMEAKQVILTHFSQRYAHIVPLFNMRLPPNVGLAFDNMQVCPNTVSRLASFIPALSALFADELKKLEIKKMKRDLEQKDQVEDVVRS